MKPVKDRLLVERCKAEDKEKKILLLETKPNNKYEVRGVGREVSIDVSLGDKVLIEPYGLIAIENEEKRELFVVSENNIYLVL